MLLVFVGGVMTVNAATKRIYVNQQISGWTSNINTYGLNLFLEKGSTAITSGWPGSPMTKINDSWFYIDVDSEETGVTAALVCPVTDNYWYVGSDYRVNIDLTNNNVIYLFEQDSKAKMSSGVFGGYVIAKSYSSSDKISDLTQSGLKLTGSFDMSGEKNDVDFRIFPAILSNGYYIGALALSPNTSNDFELSSFIPYNNNIVYGDSKKWTEKAHQKYDVTVNLSTNTFTFTPYFERTIAGAQYGDYFYSTFSSSNNVAIPSNITAYYANSTQDNKVIMTAFVNGIRSTDGAFLRLPSGNDTYKFSAVTTTDSPTTNYLTPSNGSAPAGSYVFARQNGAVGFFKVSSGLSTGLADKAYLELPSTAPSLDIEFDDGETTGIYKIEADDFDETIGNGQMYDLQGRRVAEPAKGVYIVNGKKVIIK